MKNSFIIVFFVVINFIGFSQTDTIKLQASKNNLYRCVSEKATKWFIYTEDENVYYLSVLDLSNKEAFEWFIRFKDSQNIYTGQINKLIEPKTLIFHKPDQPDDSIRFYVVRLSKNEIIVSSDETKENFVFKKTN